MPCRDEYADANALSLARQRSNDLAQMLCALCRQCEAQDAAHWIDEAGAGAWWTAHKREDERRLAADAERQRAGAEQRAEDRRGYMTAIRDTVVVFTDDELERMGLRRIATERRGDTRVIV